MRRTSKVFFLVLVVDIITSFAILSGAALARAQVVTVRDESIVRTDRPERPDVPPRPTREVCDTTNPGDVHCDSKVVTDGNLQPLSSPRYVFGYGPVQFLKAYNLTGFTSSGSNTIAIVDAYDDPNIQRDLDTYSATFGIPLLPACSSVSNPSIPCFKKVDQRGGTRYPRADSGWALEIALDVETAHAVCQNCNILLVEANSSSYSNLMAAVDRAVALGASVVSNSWGSGEFGGESYYDSHFNHPGVAFTVSSGDSGYGAEYPAASPYVTAVGGTSLYLNRDGSYNYETAWTGAGSGCSLFEGKPTWQTDTGCANRTVADVSADADPNTGAAVYDSVRYYGQSGWFQVGGTSLASPIVAAVYALSGNTAGNANQIPYLNSGNLRDITSGSNGYCGGSYLCSATNGYDGPTGLGTPNGTAAF
jgi:subtilase family serine protease